MSRYNYARFDNSLYSAEPFAFHAPKVGECATDFEAQLTDGTKVRLSDYKGKRIIFETGSATCPMFGGNIARMNEIADRYSNDPSIVFLLLYTREAHPAPKCPAHRDDEHKLKTAKRIEPMLSRNRIVIVDDVKGSIHRQWGEFPNSLWFIGADGVVLFRTDWNKTEILEHLLNATNVETEATKFGEHNMPAMTPGPALRWLWNKAGWLGIWDVLKQIPGMRERHQEVHRLYDGVRYMAPSTKHPGACF